MRDNNTQALVIQVFGFTYNGYNCVIDYAFGGIAKGAFMKSVREDSNDYDYNLEDGVHLLD